MPHFLFSYARQDVDPYLEHFFAALRTETRALVGGALHDAGFMDHHDIEVGADWAGELIDVLCTCQTMVAVYSPSYFKRHNCGKEWAVMTQRIEQHRNEHGRDLPNIVPVNWVPDLEIPEPASAVQWRDARFGEIYAEKGLRWIAQRMNKDQLERQYLDIVTALATRIRDLVLAPNRLPELPYRPAWDDVEQAFPQAEPPSAKASDQPNRQRDGGPANVHIVVVAGSREEMAAFRQQLDYYGAVAHDWRPFHPSHNTRLSAYAVQLIARRGINPYLQPAGRRLSDVLDEAGAANEVVVILLDAWSAAVASYKDELRRYDERNEVTSVVMVPRNKDDDEALSRADEVAELLHSAMPKSLLRRDVLFKFGSGTLQAFRRDMTRAVLEAQDRCFKLAEVRRVFPSEGPTDPPQLITP